MKNEKNLGTDLKGLDPADFPESNDDPLDVDLSDIDVPEVKEGEAQKVQETATGIASWMKTHLQKLDNLSAKPEVIQARSENKKAMRNIWDRIHKYMNHSEAGYRQTAWLEFLLHQFESPEIETWDDLERITEWLIRNQYLERNEHGQLKTPWGKGLAIPKDVTFGTAQLRQIKGAWDKTMKRVSRETAENRTKRIRQIRDDKNNISDIDLLIEEVDGTALLYVPAELSIRNGEPNIFNPGFLLVRREDDKLFLIEGIGSFDRKIREMKQGKTYVRAYALTWKFPPSKKKLMEDNRFTEEQAKDLCFAWYLLRRAYLHLSKPSEEGPPEELLRLGALSSGPTSEFLLGQQDGIALIELDGPVVIIGEDRSRTVIDKVFFLVERKNRKFKLLEVPSGLETILDAKSFSGEFAEGDQFEGLPQPLQALLKMAYFEAKVRGQ
ncbi:MAG: hypothetical protein NTW46_00340 [Candidatus Nealsonbacteria bacterium]|nr:hypothetical protein [Candidatus Nealsonbacteria bacterium]